LTIASLESRRELVYPPEERCLYRPEMADSSRLHAVSRPGPCVARRWRRRAGTA